MHLKSIVRKLVAVVMAMTMTMGISATVLAAPSDTKVQINGVNLDMKDSKPIMKDDRVYVPMRTIFEALGAEVAFDEASSTITATRSTETLQFVVGSKELTLDKGGVKSVIKTETPALAENGTTYIPVRFIADAYGSTVNWDSNTQTAIILDGNKLLSELNGKFTIMDKYLAFNKEFISTAQTFSGNITYDMKITDPTITGEEIPIKLNGTLSGITEGDKLNMKIALKMDPESLKMLIAEASKTAEGTEAVVAPTAQEIKEVTDVLNNMNFDFIMDMTSGKFYMSMPGLDEFMGAEKNTWYELDLDAIFAMADMPDVNMAMLMNMAKTDNFAEFLSSFMMTMPATSSENSQVIAQLVDLYLKMYGDSAFTKEADGYSTTFKANEADTQTSMTMKFVENNGNITGYKMDTTAKIPGVTEMTMKATQTGSDCTMSMNFNVAGMMNMVFNADIKYVPSTSKALSKPSAGAVIVSVNDMLGLNGSSDDSKAAPESVSPAA